MKRPCQLIRRISTAVWDTRAGRVPRVFAAIVLAQDNSIFFRGPGGIDQLEPGYCRVPRARGRDRVMGARDDRVGVHVAFKLPFRIGTLVMMGVLSVCPGTISTLQRVAEGCQCFVRRRTSCG